MIKEIESLIDDDNLTKEEKKQLREYAESLLSVQIGFEKQLIKMKSNVEFSQSIIDIIKQLTKDYKDVKRNS